MNKSKKIIPVNVPKISKHEKKFVNECLKTNWISSEGKFVKLFEEKFSKFNNRKYGVAVSNGTAALEVAVKSLNLKKNAEVIIPAFSIISTALCVIKAGLKPVLVDCEIDTWNVGVKDVLSKINKNTSAIIITHIYGLPVDLNKILVAAKRSKIKIIEDAAEVIGQTYLGKKCGSFGDVSTFSFYANKHITTGEGGMLLTNKKDIYKKCISLRNLSFSKSYYNRFDHDDIGWNYRITNLQAALGCGQLKNINWIVRRKREIGNRYYNNFRNLKNIILQKNITSYSKNIYWVFGIVLDERFTQKRNNIMNALLKKGIITRPFFVPMHKQTIFKKMNLFKNIKMPISERISSKGFYLPSGLGIKNEEIDYVSKNLIKILN